MASRQWGDLPRPVRIGLVVCGAADAALRVWSLVDLARRPPGRVRGRKAVWAIGLTGLNSVGILPLIYLTKGRR